MKRIFPDVIDAYHRLGGFYSSDDSEGDKIYEEYFRLLPTIQDYFRHVSNKKAIEAGVKMGIVANSRKSANKKKIIILRRIMNLFREIPPRLPDKQYSSIAYGLCDPNEYGYPTKIWLEYWWNPLEVIVGTKLDIEDDDPYQVAIAIAEYYRIHRWEEFCELYKKYQTCCTK